MLGEARERAGGSVVGEGGEGDGERAGGGEKEGERENGE